MSPFIDERLLALLDHYVAGECTSAEVEEVRAWLSASAENRPVLADVERIRTVAHNRPPVRSAEAAWQHAVAELELETRSRRDPPVRVLGRISTAPSRSRFATRVAAVAAVLVAGVSVGTLLSVRSKPGTRQMAAPIALLEYSTPRGQSKTVDLPDGSRITLAADSRVRFPGTFGARGRDVGVDGEALVTVAHETNRPFRIHSKNAEIEDIGTRFDIRSYPEDSAVRVIVAEGEVALSGRRSASALATSPMTAPARRSSRLRRGDIGVLKQDGTVTRTTTANPELYSGWSEGTLQLVRAPLSEVAQVIGRWYDLDVEIVGSDLPKRTVTATISVKAPEEMLSMLALAVNARAERNGRTVRLIANTAH